MPYGGIFYGENDMIKPDMKVGDIFEDGGIRYEVLEVNEDGTYISTVTDAIANVTPTELPFVDVPSAETTETQKRRRSTKK